MRYRLETPNHGTGNLITNLARLCGLPLTENKEGRRLIRGEIPCYRDGRNRKVWILRFAGTKVANVFPDGTIERKAYVPAIAKTLMSQTKDYRLPVEQTLVKTYILDECKFHTDLHTHMNANLSPDLLIALGIHHQIAYPLYYVKKLKLRLTEEQAVTLQVKRRETEEKENQENEKRPPAKKLQGKYLTRRIDDHTYINFADLILNNIPDAAWNISKIRASLAVMKDGQAVFTNLEKVYLYRYVFTKGNSSQELLPLRNIGQIPDPDIVRALEQMERDRKNPSYRKNTIFQDGLLWIARTYADNGIVYAEISDTTLVKKEAAPEMLAQVHAVIPAVTEETGVTLRFLAALRRTPLTIVKDRIAPPDYFTENLQTLHGVMTDPYVAGSDFVGEEMNDIRELSPVIREIVRMAAEDPSFVIRVHAGENDSLPDNVANAIQCVEKSLLPGQKFPHMRIGHGLYTANLNTEKGRRLMHKIRDRQVVLEFQITSNVRLNNLSALEKHPLKQYLAENILCVQGTDGGALYGTDSIDEQLSLQNLLFLSVEEMKKMRGAEDVILQAAESDFEEKKRKMELALPGDALYDTEDRIRLYYQKKIAGEEGNYLDVLKAGQRVDPAVVLEGAIRPLPQNKVPVIVAGGSFNNDRHLTRVRKETADFLNRLLKEADPEKIFFVVGSSLSGYEKYLLEQNRKRRKKDRFEIFSFVPSAVTAEEAEKLKASHVGIRVSIEPNQMGVYKSVAFEIFRRRNSVILALDGNSAAANLIQDAKNSRYECRIFVSTHSRKLMTKALSLEGYVTILKDEDPAGTILKYTDRYGKKAEDEEE